MPDNLVSPFIKDLGFEKVLNDVNELLNTLEKEYIANFRQPQYPVIFIAGTQRSGTTLLMQLLIACFKVSYVSNLMARFWRAPYIGALLARELRRKQRSRSPDFVSELGTTYGYDGPHEFGYFWQRWFPYNETHQTSDDDLSKIDFNLFRRELAAMESVFDAPLAFKNPIVFSLHIKKLADILPQAVFLVCQREPLHVAQSTLLSRLKFHGRKDTWFSIKPKEYTWLKERPYTEQIAGQIFYTEKRIKESLQDIGDDRYLFINYEELCQDPKKVLRRVKRLVDGMGHDLMPTGYKPMPFESQNLQKVDNEELEGLKAALRLFWQ